MKLIEQTNGKYNHVLAAKNIRVELKEAFPGHKFSVKSKSFSMGDSVDVRWVDGPTTKEVDGIIDKYQHGHFNGMEDIYESNYTSFHDKHGSTKYTGSSRTLSFDAEVQILNLISEKYGVDVEQMEISKEKSYCGKYDKAKYNYNLRIENANEWLSTMVYREGSGISFYHAENKPHMETERNLDGVTITENNEKGGLEIRFSSKPPRDILDRLKENGFRWHRKLQFWYAKKTAARTELANSLKNADITPKIKVDKAASPTGQDPRIKKFRSMADGLGKHIESKRTPMSQNPTPKRMREYNTRIKDADDLENTQAALYAMASAIESNTLPEILRTIKNKGDIEPLVRTGYTTNGYYDYHGTGQYADKSPEAAALQTLIESNKTSDQIKAQADLEKRKEIERLENTVRFSKIDGFFPTPLPVIEKMVEIAEINSGDCVYDPEAGKGDIADFITEKYDGVEVFVGEINHTLQGILKAKGHNIISTDFMEYDNGRRFNKIIMNPPFEHLQDIEHIQHAYRFLSDGGRIVSMVSEGPFFRTDKKSSNFREWLDSVGGYTEKMENGSFTGRDSFRQTGVSTRIVVIDN